MGRHGVMAMAATFLAASFLAADVTRAFSPALTSAVAAGRLARATTTPLHSLRDAEDYGADINTPNPLPAEERGAPRAPRSAEAASGAQSAQKSLSSMTPEEREELRRATIQRQERRMVEAQGIDTSKGFTEEDLSLAKLKARLQSEAKANTYLPSSSAADDYMDFLNTTPQFQKVSEYSYGERTSPGQAPTTPQASQDDKPAQNKRNPVSYREALKLVREGRLTQEGSATPSTPVAPASTTPQVDAQTTSPLASPPGPFSAKLEADIARQQTKLVQEAERKSQAKAQSRPSPPAATGDPESYTGQQPSPPPTQLRSSFSSSAPVTDDNVEEEITSVFELLSKHAREGILEGADVEDLRERLHNIQDTLYNELGLSSKSSRAADPAPMRSQVPPPPAPLPAPVPAPVQERPTLSAQPPAAAVSSPLPPTSQPAATSMTRPAAPVSSAIVEKLLSMLENANAMIQAGGLDSVPASSLEKILSVSQENTRLIQSLLSEAPALSSGEDHHYHALNLDPAEKEVTITKALGYLLKHRGGVGYGAGRLRPAEAELMAEMLSTVGRIIADEQI